MKHNILSALCVISFIYAAEEIQQVIDITPDKPVLPAPPLEIKATDMLYTGSKEAPTATDSTTVSAPKKSAAKKSKTGYKKSSKNKKSFDQMDEAEQIKVLKHKIDKLRERSHEVRAKLRAVKKEIAELRQQMATLAPAAPEIVEESEEIDDLDNDDNDSNQEKEGEDYV